MTLVMCKGTAIQLEIGTVYTTIAQVISIDGPESESLDLQMDTVDNAVSGIPRKVTGQSQSGPVSGELFFDPVLATHQAITDLITTPASSNWKQIWADDATTEWAFTGAGVSFGPRVALGQGLRANFRVNVDGLPTFAT